MFRKKSSENTKCHVIYCKFQGSLNTEVSNKVFGDILYLER